MCIYLPGRVSSLENCLPIFYYRGVDLSDCPVNVVMLSHRSSGPAFGNFNLGFVLVISCNGIILYGRLYLNFQSLILGRRWFTVLTISILYFDLVDFDCFYTFLILCMYVCMLQEGVALPSHLTFFCRFLSCKGTSDIINKFYRHSPYGLSL